MFTRKNIRIAVAYASESATPTPFSKKEVNEVVNAIMKSGHANNPRAATHILADYERKRIDALAKGIEPDIIALWEFPIKPKFLWHQIRESILHLKTANKTAIIRETINRLRKHELNCLRNKIRVAAA